MSLSLLQGCLLYFVGFFGFLVFGFGLLPPAPAPPIDDEEEDVDEPADEPVYLGFLSAGFKI